MVKDKSLEERLDAVRKKRTEVDKQEKLEASVYNLRSEKEVLEQSIQEAKSELDKLTDKISIEKKIADSPNEKLKRIVTSSSGLIKSSEVCSILSNIESEITLPIGRYVIDKDVFVRESGRLNMLPGTELYFEEDTGIISLGILNAIGNNYEKIKFTALNNYWNNIYLFGNLSSNSVIKFCDISKGSGLKKEIQQGAKNRKYGSAILIVDSSATIINCKLSNNFYNFKKECYVSGGAICLFKSSSVIESNEIFNINKYTPILILESNVQILNNHIRNNNVESSGGGLACENSTVLIKNNQISNNFCGGSGGGIFIYDSFCVIDNNTINFNESRCTKNNKSLYEKGGGIFVDGRSLKGNVVNIKNNYITRNFPEGVFYRGTPKISFYNNRIFDNVQGEVNTRCQISGKTIPFYDF